MTAPSTNQLYTKMLPKWQLVERAVTTENINKELRNVGALECEEKVGIERQEYYERGATYDNFPLNTLNTNVGTIELKDAQIELPAKLEYLRNDVSGGGMSLDALISKCLLMCLSKGRATGVVGVEQKEGGAAPSAGEQAAGRFVPRIAIYDAEDNPDWCVESTSHGDRLKAVLLRELAPPANDCLFSESDQYQYRTLFINADGYYEQIVSVDGAKDGEAQSQGLVRQNGQLMTHMPVYYLGSQNNDPTPDTPPLLSISELALGCYRNSADAEEDSFTTSQHTATVSPGNNSQFDVVGDEKPKVVRLGCTSAINLGEGGSASLLSASSDSLAVKLMNEKRDQAASQGAIMDDKASNVSAETARLQSTARASLLTRASKNTSAFILNMLQECALFMGANPDDIVFKINTDFILETLSAQDLAAWGLELERGNIPEEVYFYKLKNSGNLPDAMDLEQFKDLRAAQQSID